MMPWHVYDIEPDERTRLFEARIAAICAALPPAFQGEDDVQRTQQLFRAAYLTFFEEVPHGEQQDRYESRVADLYRVTDEWLEAAGDALFRAVEYDDLRSWLWVGYAGAWRMLRPDDPLPACRPFQGTRTVTGAALLDALAALDPKDAVAVNAWNWRAFLYVRPADAPASGRYLYVERPDQDVLLPRAPDMHLLPDLRSRIMVEAMARGEAL